MTDHAWIKEFPAAITVCDVEGIILEMNDKAAKTFESDGGYDLDRLEHARLSPRTLPSKNRKAFSSARQKRLHHRKERHQKTHLSIPVV